MGFKYIYFFGGGRAEGGVELRHLLGAKGANLAEMARIGVPVPPGFTITTGVCAYYFNNNRTYPPGLKQEVEEGLSRIAELMGARFGDPEAPLLLSIRSGAAVSMPGMMETVLNLGLNDETVKGLAFQSHDDRFAYDSYRRFIQMYAGVVMGVDRRALERVVEARKVEKGISLDIELSTDDLRDIVERMKARVRELSGREFPQDPVEQLWGAISAVLDSWNAPRAIAYRELHRIDHGLGTAVNVQAMVFGNMGEDSGTGVAFSRDPRTGERKLFGEFLPNAQGEDIVAGTRTPRPISDLEVLMPHCYRELEQVAARLERHFKEMQDIEFTIQRGKLWVLQTRTGKRTPQAAIRIAVDMVKERLISGREAFLRIEPREVEHVLHPTLEPGVEKEVVCRGLPASPGVAVGRVVFDPEEAVRLAERGENVILVREETSADDIKGIAAAAGVLTMRGGVTSHAAVVTRSMGKPAVVGCGEILIEREREEFKVRNRVFRKGDWITLDGSSGEVMAGRLPVASPGMAAELKELMLWSDMVKRLRVMANADNPQDAHVARQFGAEGIGLCRTEHMFFQEERIDFFRRAILAETQSERRECLNQLLPYQVSDFAAIFREMEGLPVTIRLLDPPLHEFLPLPYLEEELKVLARRLEMPFGKLKERVQSLKEFNPMLGHRGCRLGITYPEIYQMQVRAVLEAASRMIAQGYHVFPEIMIPFVGHVKEVEFLRKLIDSTLKEVQSEFGVRGLHCRIGVMIELPRAALTAAEIAPLVDFFSFGTNDLTQTTFGLSRDDAGTFLPLYLEKGLFEYDPFITLDRSGVGELIRIAVEAGRKANPGLKIGICGEHGGDPDSVEFCHRIGLDYVSCSPYRVPVARFAASRAVVKEEERR